MILQEEERGRLRDRRGAESERVVCTRNARKSGRNLTKGGFQIFREVKLQVGV